MGGLVDTVQRTLYLIRMASKDEDKKALWVGWTHDAMLRYTAPEEDIDDDEDLIDSMVDVAIGYADAMLEEYENRFEGGGKRRRKKTKPDPEPDPDDD